MRTLHGLKFTARTRVLDHADEMLFVADRARAEELYCDGSAEIIRSKGRICGLRLSGPDPALLPGEAGRHPQVGLPHRHENYWNVRGVWHVDPIPLSLAPLFGRIA